MDEARQRAAWERAAWLACNVRSFAFGNKKRWTMRECNPFEAARAAARPRRFASPADEERFLTSILGEGLVSG